jgi:hypothetical protein
MHLTLDGSQSGLVAYYNFDETSGTALPDRARTSNLHNGSLTNMIGNEWHNSTIPAGSGASVTGTEANGPVTFAGANLTMDFSVIGPTDVTVTRINAGPPNALPVNGQFLSPWWTVDRSGSGTYTATMTFTFDSGQLTPADESNLSSIGLYNRPVGSDGAWTLVKTADSINSAGNIAVFNNVSSSQTDINDQSTGGQYAVGRTNLMSLIGSGTTSWSGDDSGSRIAVGDYDNDGLPDLALTDGIYHNDGNGAFHRVMSSYSPSISSAMAWGDYDNDGYIDLAVINRDGTYVYHNNGNGTFTQVASLGIKADNPSPSSISWADYNNDGRLDLLVAKSNNTRLFHNNGSDGSGNYTFTDANAGLPGIGHPDASWGDYDNDSLLDLALTSPARVYHNNGDGTFTQIFSDSDSIYSRSSLAWGDYDNNGRLDLVVVTAGGSHLYRNNGPDTGGTYSFSDVNTTIPAFGLFSQVAWGDYDNDGRPDLQIATIPDSSTYINRGVWVYHNNGDTTFTDLIGSLAQSAPYASTWFDYDNSGRLGVVLEEGNPTDYRIYKNTRPRLW